MSNLKFADKYIRGMFDDVLEIKPENNIDEILEQRFRKGKNYKIKLIESGPILEVLIYQIWDTKNGDRQKKEKPSRAAQEKLNGENAKERCTRIINANFVPCRDTWITLTYDTAPDTIEQAIKDRNNFIGRCKRYCKRAGLADFRCVHATEFGDKRVHHHLVTNIQDLNILEQLWTSQSERAKKRKNPFYNMRLIGRTTVRRLQDDDCGLEGLARYISKDSKKNQKRYGYTLNCDKPNEKEYTTLNNRRISSKKVKAMARDKEEFENVLQKAFGADYHVSQAAIKVNDFVGGLYLYGKLKYFGDKNVYGSGNGKNPTKKDKKKRGSG